MFLARAHNIRLSSNVFFPLFLETGVKSAEIANQSFFSPGIADNRYITVKYEQFVPEQALTTTGPVEIILPAIR